MTLSSSFVVTLGIGRIITWKWICFAVINKVVVFLIRIPHACLTWTFYATYKWILKLNCCYILHLLWSVSLYLAWVTTASKVIYSRERVVFRGRYWQPTRPIRARLWTWPTNENLSVCLPLPAILSQLKVLVLAAYPHNKTEFQHKLRGPLWLKTHGDS